MALNRSPSLLFYVAWQNSELVPHSNDRQLAYTPDMAVAIALANQAPLEAAQRELAQSQPRFTVLKTQVQGAGDVEPGTSQPTSKD